MDNKQFALGLRTIAAGLIQIAMGFEGTAAPAAVEDYGKKHTDGSRSGGQKPKDPDAEVNQEQVRQDMDKPPFETEEPPEPGDIALEDLQELGASLIRAGKRDDLKKVLADMKLKSLSSCPTEDFPKLWAALTEASK